MKIARKYQGMEILIQQFFFSFYDLFEESEALPFLLLCQVSWYLKRVKKEVAKKKNVLFCAN